MFITVWVVVFLVTTPCSLIDGNQRFEGTFSTFRVNVYPEDGFICSFVVYNDAASSSDCGAYSVE
jgi:hypothetical protein